MSYLRLRGLGKSFGPLKVVQDFDLDVSRGEMVCLLGPSGSGKSTVLRMIGGFESPTEGVVEIDGEDVTRMPPEKRPTTMVFQSHALWSHMSVAENIGFGLKLHGMDKLTVRQKVADALELVGLGGLGKRRVDELSGGQKQRVALARSLVLEPKILLLDEPFASLDQHLRERLREEVRDIQQRLSITALFVTHGQDEALALADRIVVIRDGRIEQVEAPGPLYHAPETEFVAGFIGSMNFLDGEVKGGRFRHPALEANAPISDGPARLAVRPEALRATPDGAAHRSAVLHRATDFGTHVQLDVEVAGGHRIKSMAPPGTRIAVDTAVNLRTENHAYFRDGRAVWRGAE